MIQTVLRHNVAIEIFDQFESNSFTGQEIDISDLFMICSATVDNHGAICFDISCKALKGKPFKLSSQKRLKQLIVRDYKDGIFNSDNTSEFYALEELVISQGEPGNKKLVENAGGWIPWIEMLPSMVLDGIVVEAPPSKRNDLRLHRESSSFPFLGRMPNLRKIFISAGGSRLSPTGLDKLSKLEEITIIDNPVGDDFKMFATMNNLNKLVLFNCGLHQLPAGLEYCSKLQELVIHHSEIHGNDPLNLPELVNLRKLDLSHCGLHKMPDLRECSDLQELILRDNKFITSGDDSIFISKLKYLKKLDMSSCHLRQIPDGLAGCLELEELDLSCNRVRDVVHIPRLKHLKKLHFSTSNLRKVPDGLEDCLELQEMDLHGNRMDEHAIVIPNLPCLVRLKLFSCELQQFPSGIEDCPKLQELNLHGNLLLGESPVTFPKLENLVELDLSLCGLRELPTSLE